MLPDVWSGGMVLNSINGTFVKGKITNSYAESADYFLGGWSGVAVHFRFQVAETIWIALRRLSFQFWKRKRI
jgi:hypothetical protein